jgi:hypothetical protein
MQMPDISCPIQPAANSILRDVVVYIGAINRGFGMQLKYLLVLVMILSGGVLFAQDPPEAPVNLTVKGDFEGSVAVANLRWQDESDDEIGFEVLRSDNGEEFQVVGFVGANTSRYKDKVGKYMTGSFTYKVRAFNEDGKSAETNPANVWF